MSQKLWQLEINNWPFEEVPLEVVALLALEALESTSDFLDFTDLKLELLESRGPILKTLFNFLKGYNNSRI